MVDVDAAIRAGMDAAMTADVDMDKYELKAISTSFAICDSQSISNYECKPLHLFQCTNGKTLA